MRATIVLLLSVVTLGATAAPALATPGALSQPAGAGGCISEDGTGGQCVVGHGLSDSAGVAVSPDGRNVYVVSTQGQSIASFARNPGSGALTETGCLGAQPPGPTDPCTQVAAGLSAPDTVTVSGDGRSVYVTNHVGELTVFARDPVTGALSQPAGEECVSSAAPYCPAGGVALEGASGVVVSPDATGHNVYVASGNDQAVAEFSRDSGTSRLTQPTGNAACVSRNGTATSGTGTPADCLIAPDGFLQPRALAISSDGADLFTTDKAAHALWDLGRDPATGILSTPACYGAAGCETVHGLDDARGVAVSPDGKAVFVVSATPGSIAVLQRTPGGSLSQKALSAGPGALYDCFTNDGSDGCVQGRALAGASAVVVTPDGANVYVSALNSGAIAAFTRNPATDQLQQITGTEGCLSYNGSGGQCTPGHLLEGLVSIAASPDGRNLYGVSSNHSALLVINREQPALQGTPPGARPPGPSVGGGSGAAGTPGLPHVIVSHFSIRIQRRRAGRPVRGALRFQLSRAANVRITVHRAKRAGRSPGRCERATRHHRRPSACARRVLAGSLTRRAAAGHTTMSFASRIGTARLTPGVYTATVVAREPRGPVSRPATASFSIKTR